MDGLALAVSDVPLELIEQHGLQRLAHERGGEQEFRFLRRSRVPLLPVWHDGQLRIVRWGCRSGPLPRCGLTWLRTVESGDWQPYSPEPIEIPAVAGWNGGVWFRIRKGIRGLLVNETAYMLIEPATYYYRVMTRSESMPVLIDERI